MVKIKMYDKLSALEKLGKFQGLFGSDINLNLFAENMGVVTMPAKLPVGAPVDLNARLEIPEHAESPRNGEKNGGDNSEK